MNNEGKGQEGQEGQAEGTGFNPDAFASPSPIKENGEGSSNENGNEGSASSEGASSEGSEGNSTGNAALPNATPSSRSRILCIASRAAQRECS